VFRSGMGEREDGYGITIGDSLDCLLGILSNSKFHAEEASKRYALCPLSAL